MDLHATHSCSGTSSTKSQLLGKGLGWFLSGHDTCGTAGLTACGLLGTNALVCTKRGQRTCVKLISTSLCTLLSNTA